MYIIDIVTEYNTIHLEVEDIYRPEIMEIFNQPYIISVTIHRDKRERSR